MSIHRSHPIRWLAVGAGSHTNNLGDFMNNEKGAAEGAGLGNAFLSHIRAVDAIYMMLRAFENADITHVEGDVNPVRDIEIINEELLLKVCVYTCNVVLVLLFKVFCETNSF